MSSDNLSAALTSGIVTSMHASMSGSAPGVHERRPPECYLCRNHGISVRRKGHKMNCPYRRCICNSCLLTRARLEVMTKQVALRRAREVCKNVSVQTAFGFHLELGEYLGSLSEDLGNLLDSGMSADVEIQCGGHSLKVHEIVLIARSPVFKAMLQTSMMEGLTKKVIIPGIDFSNLYAFIRYLYTDKLQDIFSTFDRTVTLYKISHLYEVRSLMDQCALWLQENLCPENLDQCVELANLYSHKQLTDIIVSYLLKEKLPLRHDFWFPFIEKNKEIAEKVWRLWDEGSPKSKVDKCEQTVPFLYEDFGNLFHSDMGHDVEVQCGDKSIKAHKIVLSARSRVLKERLLNNTMNGQTDKVEIQDIDSDYLEDFIWYLYTDELPYLSFPKEDLFIIGYKYGIRSLMKTSIIYRDSSGMT